MTTLLILGAAVWPDGPSPTLKRRALKGAALYHEGRARRIIACGGLGKHPPSEAEVIRDLLVEAGVPEAVIALEDLSTTTAENIAFAKPMLTASEVLIVTDWYHAPRARLCARRLGLTPRTASPSLRGARLLPQIKGLLREIPAYLLYFFRRP